MTENNQIVITLPAFTPSCSSKIRLANNWDRDTLLVSLYPQPRTEKPTDEDFLTISPNIAKFPNILTIDQLKEEIAVNGKSFIGSLFIDLDFYKSVYGRVTSSAIVKQSFETSYLIWVRNTLSYAQNLEIEQDIFEKYNCNWNNVRRIQDYFVLMSTFGLDVDHKHNEKGEDITPAYGEMYKEVRQRIIDYDLNTLFAYKTFSDPVKGERFRVIFKTDVPIFNWELAHSLLLGLEQLFKEYFDPACKDVNRIFHGGSSLIEEEHSLFGTPVELDKFFRIVAQDIKNKDKSNYNRNLEKFARKTGLVIRNNAFAIRTVELSDDEVQELRKNELETYNKEFMEDYHFEVSADTHKDFFKEENFDEIVGTYYIYIRQYDDLVKNKKHKFYEICMSANKFKKQKREKSKVGDDETDEQEQQEEYTFEVYKQSGKIESIQLKDWQVVSDKCQLYKEFTEGKKEMQHDLLFKLSLSLMYFVGGTKRFLETITNFTVYEDELRKDWNGYIDYNKRAGYSPATCDNFCPYARECNHIRNMRDTVAPRNGIFTVGKIDFVEIAVIEQQLKEELRIFYKGKKGFVLYD
jgi:hypothetical protein